MKIYLREKNGTIVDWWNNFGESACKDIKADFDPSNSNAYYRIYNQAMQEAIESWGGQVSPEFWNAKEGEYLEFEREQDAAMFLLRWS